MADVSKEDILLSSKGWVASFLNFFPGIGSGYIYQRRWIAYFLTLGVVTAWFITGIILQGDKQPTNNEQLVGITGIFLISLVTALESNIAYRKAANIKRNKFK